MTFKFVISDVHSAAEKLAEGSLVEADRIWADAISRLTARYSGSEMLVSLEEAIRLGMDVGTVADEGEPV